MDQCSNPDPDCIYISSVEFWQSSYGNAVGQLHTLSNEGPWNHCTGSEYQSSFFVSACLGHSAQLLGQTFF